MMEEYALKLRGRVGPDFLLQLPSVSVAVRDAERRVLLLRHVQGGAWLLPGGSIEPAERPADAAVREVYEETGLLVELTDLIGVFGGPDFVVEYRNGDRTSYVMVVFEAVARGGKLSLASDEALEVDYFGAEQMQQLQLARWMPPVLAAVLEQPRGGPAFQPPGWAPEP